MIVEPCKCGKQPHYWKFGDVYLCGCINSKCRDVFPEKSLKSKEDAIRKQNEKRRKNEYRQYKYF